MTLAIERPITVTPVPRNAPGTFPCREGVPWCNDEYSASDEDHGTHWSGELYMPATGGRMPDGRLSGARWVSVLIEQSRSMEPTIALNVAYNTASTGDSDNAEMTLDEAEQLGLFLLDWVARLRGGEVQ